MSDDEHRKTARFSMEELRAQLQARNPEMSEPQNYVDHGIKFANMIFTERGLFALLFVFVLGFGMYLTQTSFKELRADQETTSSNVKAMMFQQEKLIEQLRELRREQRESNQMRWYGSRFQNPYDPSMKERQERER